MKTNREPVALRALACAAAAALVAGCAAKVTSDVTTFHRMGGADGRTVAVVAADASKAASLEFEGYADMIADELDRAGLRTVRDPAVADLVAEVDYGVDEGREKVRSRPSVYGGYGFGRGGFGLFGVGMGGYYESRTVFRRELSLAIVEQAGGRRIFEAEVTSEGRNPHLHEIMPHMIEAMFEDFPGPDGATRTVTKTLPYNGVTNY